MLLRADLSAIGSSRQVRFLRVEVVLTCILSRGYWARSDAKAEHSLSICILARGWPFAAPSAILVSTRGGTKNIMDEPDNRRWPLVNLRAVQ